MIKAAFFDIDGTLVSLKKKVAPASTIEAIHCLKNNGILSYVATGRSRFEILSEHLLDTMQFDGFLTNNGQDAYTSSGELIYGKPLDTSDVQTIASWCKNNNIAYWFVTSEETVISQINERVVEAMEAIHTKHPMVCDLTPLLNKPIFKIVLFADESEISDLMPLLSHCASTQWHRYGHDILALGGGKIAAIQEICRQHSISISETIAFGDGNNDISMLHGVGIGVAMGNSSQAVKDSADYVTDDCDEDGLYNALKHFNLI